MNRTTSLRTRLTSRRREAGPGEPVVSGDPQSPSQAGAGGRWAPRWPAYAAAVSVGLFCVVVLGIVAKNLFVDGEPLGDTGPVLLLAVALRTLTVVMALATVRPWGGRVPGWMLLGGVWGAAGAQLIYPIAETVVKLLILTDVMAPIDKGISDMSSTGWFNFAAAWLIWGIPGALFVLIGLSYQRRSRTSLIWTLLGGLGGIALIFLLGALIG